MMSSVTPSLKYSCPGSSLELRNGMTAIDGLSLGATATIALEVEPAGGSTHTPKGGHRGVHGIGADDHAFPDQIQQFVDAQYFSCPLCEANQQLHRLRFELDRLTFLADFIQRRIDTQVSDSQ